MFRPEYGIIVAEHESEEIIGYCDIGPPRESRWPCELELNSIYILPDHQRRRHNKPHPMLSDSGVRKKFEMSLKSSILVIAGLVIVIIGWSLLDQGTTKMTPRYKISKLAAPGGFESTSANSINDLGQVIGRADNPTGTTGYFVWDRKGKPTEILLGVEGLASFSHIDNQGRALGSLFYANEKSYQFVWSSSEGLRRITFLEAGVYFHIKDMNESGELVGTSRRDGGPANAVLWNASLEMQVTESAISSWLVQINNMGTKIGWETDKGPFLKRNNGDREFIDFEPESSIVDMNDREVVIGDSGGAFVWSATNGTRFLESLDGLRVYAQAINNRDQVVGSGRPQQGSTPPRWFQNVTSLLRELVGLDPVFYSGWQGSTAFLWEDGEIMSLIDLVEDPSDWISLSIATDINEVGAIVGYGIHREVTTGWTTGFVLTPIEDGSE